MRQIYLSILASLVLTTALKAQDELWLEGLPLNQNNGLQSFAHAEYQGQFFLFGGRLDGLHQRQPFASFNDIGHNEELWVIEDDSVLYTLQLNHLPDSLLDQLRSTNMEFYQDGNLLYLIGGYGISNPSGNHITHPYLCIVDLSQLTNLQPGDQVPASAFQQIEDADFGVTGGQLRRLDSVYYLVGGHRFDGRYNPHNGPSFTQSYTNSVRRFTLSGQFPNKQVQWQSAYTDAQLLHRRDYNVAPEIHEDGSYGLIAFSGVFQNNVDLPYLNAVRIDENGYSEIPNFSQYYNHYHCANVPLFEANANRMHFLFFGGMAQYYESNGIRTQDNNVPFVPTIARVSRDSAGNFSESKLRVEMPALLGAGSEFFIADGIPQYAPGIIDYDALSGDTVLLGYIFGGIESSAPNIFFSNTGTQSSATARFFKVWLIKSQMNLSQLSLDYHENQLAWQLAPNPGGKVQIWYSEPKSIGQASEMELRFIDQSGKSVWSSLWQHQAGQKHYELKPQILKAGSYLVELYLNEKFVSVQRWVYRPY